MQKIKNLLYNDLFVYGIIIILGFLLYFKSLFFNFVYLDDNELILNNINFLSDIHNFFTAFTTDVFHVSHEAAVYYRPLLTVSFMFDAILGGASPFLFHLSSTIIHLVASILVFTLLNKLRYQRAVSFFLSIIFLVHPVLTQAVSWVPGRNDSLLAVFVLASFIFFLGYLEERKTRSIILSVSFFALAMFTKETAIVLPFMCLMYLWAVNFLRWKVVSRFLLGWFLALCAWYPLHSLAMKNPIPMTVKDMLESLFKNMPASIQLLGKIFFPFNLSVLPNISDTTFFWGIGSILLIIILVVYSWKKEKFYKNSYKMMLFGLAWFFLFLIPSFVRPDPTIIADFIEHRVYLPIVGILIFLVESRFFDNLRGKMKKLFLIAGFVVIVVFFTVTFFHQNNFANRIAFWKNASENSPHSPLAQRNMGAMYQLDNRNDLAKEYYLKTIALHNLEPMVHSNLGLIYADEGNYSEAEKEYQTEISFNPTYANAHFNLGLLYYKTNRLNQARNEWEKTLEINPDYTDATNALSIINTAEK